MHLTATLGHATHFRTDLDTADGHGLVLIRSGTDLARDGCLDWDLDVWASMARSCITPAGCSPCWD